MVGLAEEELSNRLWELINTELVRLQKELSPA